MNKNIVKTSLLAVFVFSAVLFLPAEAFSLYVTNSTHTASVSLLAQGVKVNIVHIQAYKILNETSFNIVARLEPVKDIVIDSVSVEYVYDSTDSDNIISLSTDSYSYNAATGELTAVFSGLNRDACDAVFYRIKANYSGADSGVEKSQWYPVNNPTIAHVPILRISNIDRRLVAVGSFSDVARPSHNLSVTMDIEYYFNGDPSVISTHSVILAGNSFQSNADEASTLMNIPDGINTVHYRILAIYNKDQDRIKYHTHTKDWITATVVASTNGVIGSSGGSLVLQNGDQRYGDTKISAAPGVLPADASFSISEIDKTSEDSDDILKIYGITLSDSLDKNYVITLFGDGSANDYKVGYRSSLGDEWKDFNPVKNADGTYSVYWDSSLYGPLAPNNYFALKEPGARTAGNHRPVNRAFMPGGSVAFQNLIDGDSVTIYNLRGKQVRKLTNVSADGAIRWDGKNNNGDYVETGSYIYQIRVNGKIVSGSLAFVR
ncbi:MAG: hypothetical protein LBQ47_06850 [Endomicrobium sp.]|jgi:hypothetical protein|nr:hypothetical protein [Endomicrobium sp.]